jgi:two-component system response regulator FlrC
LPGTGFANQSYLITRLIKVNSSSINPTHAVWLDPFKPIDASERTQLELADISVSMVNTLGELNAALKKAHVLIIRLVESSELLQEVLTLVNQLGHNVPVLCRVERRRMNVVVDAMRLGAFHVLPSDEWDPKAWREAVKGLTSTDIKMKSYVFVDPVSQHLLALAQRVAQTDVAALLVGPTGAGKEVLAKVIHESSPRSKGPFVAMNCAAMPEHLIEDMLFGHEKGAFTGAQKEFKGLFEQAQGGTVFLDEIGEMPIQLQAKLLRVLQEKKLNRLGSESSIDLDIRIVAATNKDLKKAIVEREFREDLYFRISTFKLKILPLSQRPGDIIPLVLQSFARHAKDNVPYILTEDAQTALESYPWPGNVRELENVIQRAVVLCSGKTISSGHLMFDEAQSHELLMNLDAPILSENGQINEFLMGSEGLSSQPKSIPTTQHSQMGSESALSSPSGANGMSHTDFLGHSAYIHNNPVGMSNDKNLAYTIDASSKTYNSGLGTQSYTGYTQASSSSSEPINLAHAVKSSEHQAILAVLQSTNSRTEAAEKLGISPRTLRYKLAQLRDRGMSVSLAE